MSVRTRKRLFVDAQVQGAIVRRLGLYFGSAIIFLFLPSAIARTVLEPDRLFFAHLGDITREYWPLLLTAIAMVPFILYDTLVLTNRFAGPIYRLRRDLQRFESGEAISPIQLREGDFWHGLAIQVNSLLERVHAAEQRSAPTEPVPSAAGLSDEPSERES